MPRLTTSITYMSHIPSHSRFLLLFTALLFFSFSAVCEDTLSVPYSTTSTRDTLIVGDSIIVIHTVCAPVCSSCARVYNKEWTFIGTLTPPFRSPFPEAYIEDGKLFWRDNYPQLLDEDELRSMEKTQYGENAVWGRRVPRRHQSAIDELRSMETTQHGDDASRVVINQQ